MIAAVLDAAGCWGKNSERIARQEATHGNRLPAPPMADRRRCRAGPAPAASPWPRPPAVIVTPGQTEGPFYPVKLPADMDADLVRVQGPSGAGRGPGHARLRAHPRPARRDRARRHGRDLAVRRAAASTTTPATPATSAATPAFQGYGRTAVDAAGRYAFRTIRPVAYPGRTPHIHFKVHAPGVGRLTTQMYVAGEPQNATDGVLNAIRDARRATSLIVALADAGDLEAGALKGTLRHRARPLIARRTLIPAPHGGVRLRKSRAMGDHRTGKRERAPCPR